MTMAFLAVRFVSVRLMQLFGNLLKLLFSLYSFLRPAARFRLPRLSGALGTSSPQKLIPRLVWTTNYTNEVTLPVYANYLWNRAMSSSYKYRFCDDNDCAIFIKNNFPTDVFEAFNSLQIGAAKADLWRILVLQKHGGVYIDIDAAFCWPLERMISNDQTELFVQLKDGSFTNHFIAACPNHPLIIEMADRILANIKENSLKSVFDMTGPTVVNDVVKGKPVAIGANRYVARQALITTKKHQYPDKLNGYWVKEQQERPIVGPNPPS